MAGLGPLTAATISQKVGGLQYALLLTPLCYVVGSALFLNGENLLAEKVKAEKAAEKAKKEAAGNLPPPPLPPLLTGSRSSSKAAGSSHGAERQGLDPASSSMIAEGEESSSGGRLESRDRSRSR